MSEDKDDKNNIEWTHPPLNSLANNEVTDLTKSKTIDLLYSLDKLLLEDFKIDLDQIYCADCGFKNQLFNVPIHYDRKKANSLLRELIYRETLVTLGMEKKL